MVRYPFGPCHTRQLLQATWRQPTAVCMQHDHFGSTRVMFKTLSYDPQKKNDNTQTGMPFLLRDCLELVAPKLPPVTWPLDLSVLFELFSTGNLTKWQDGLVIKI